MYCEKVRRYLSSDSQERTVHVFAAQRRKKRCCISAVVLGCLIGIFFFNFRSFGIISDILSLGRHSAVWIFQGNEARDFPVTEADKQTIPHIIHHYYSSVNVPEKYVTYMRSFSRMNPKWDYMFWTFESGRKLLEKFHPYLLQKYDCLGNTVQNTNIIRIAALYEFGGIYTDLDVENLRPLDKVTLKYACIFPPEPFEHATLGYKMEFVVQTATLMCRPHHPFLKLILTQFQGVSCTAPTQFNTGVAFITQLFMDYHNVTESDIKNRKSTYGVNSPVFYRGGLREDDKNAVYVPNTQYFSDNVAPKISNRLPYVCSVLLLQSYVNRRACAEFYRRVDIREERKYTFLYHHWYNSYNMYRKFYFKNMKTIHISDIVPRAIIYGDESTNSDIASNNLNQKLSRR